MFELQQFDDRLNNLSPMNFNNLQSAVSWLKTNGYCLRGDLITNRKSGFQALIWKWGYTVNNSDIVTCWNK